MIKVFISSVQSEFAEARQMLFDYIHSDALLGRFFQPFIFENCPATDQRADQLYLEEVEKSDLYVGIMGQVYGSVPEAALSPTELEYNAATKHHLYRLAFLTNHDPDQRETREQQFIKRIEQDVVWRMFGDVSELKTAVYTSLVNYLEEKELIRSGPFDASSCQGTSLEDVDPAKVTTFIKLAKAKRGFPLPETSSPELVLTHLNLLKGSQLTNTAVLLFGKQPQRYFLNSVVKCAQFHGNQIIKPIPAYHTYKGDVFELVDQAVDFVLSRIDAAVGTRSMGNQAPLEYEIPRTAISEAIVNAIAHRDYTSTGAVQVMLFHNRIEIWNPGQLPHNLTFQQLKQSHASYPANPLLAEPMYLAGYIERLGTGIPDMLAACELAGLPEPGFKQEDMFVATIWRKSAVTGEATGQATVQATGQVTGQADADIQIEIQRVILVLSGPMKRADIQEALDLKHREYFMENYLNPALKGGFVEMTHPETLTHPDQRYQLSELGLELRKRLDQDRTEDDL